MFSLYMISISGGYSMMGFIKYIPALKGDNTEWKKKIDLTFILAEVDWVVTRPCPTEPVAPVRETNESYANKNYVVVIKNTIEPTIIGSIQKCDTVTEYLDGYGA
jgi:hypothetical protein